MFLGKSFSVWVSDPGHPLLTTLDLGSFSPCLNLVKQMTLFQRHYVTSLLSVLSLREGPGHFVTSTL